MPFTYQQTLTIAIGTTPCAVVRCCLEKRNAKIAQLEHQLAKAFDPSVRSRLQDQIATLKEEMVVMALDIDGTGIYKFHRTSNNAVEEWEPGQFLQLTLPDPALVKRDLKRAIESRQPPTDFPDINLSVWRTMASISNASGGNPPAGLLAAQHHHKIIQASISQVLRFFQSRPRRVAGNRSLKVIQLGSSFGGTAAGAWEYITRLILETAKAEGIDRLNLERILLRPTFQLSATTLNSLAVTQMMDQEASAISTGYNRHLAWVPGKGELQPTKSKDVYTYHLSPENNAPAPIYLDRENFNTQVANLLWLLVATPLRNFLDSKTGDFERTANEVGPTGEYKRGRSIGLSVLFLPREWLWQYARVKGQILILDYLLAEPDEEAIDQWINDFLQNHPLVEGEGNHEITDHLLNSKTPGDNLFTLDRFRKLTSRIQTTPDNAERLVTNATSQAGDPDHAFAVRKEALVEKVAADLQRRIRLAIQTPTQGVAFIEASVADLVLRLERLIGVVREDDPYESQLAQLERAVSQRRRKPKGWQREEDALNVARRREQLHIQQKAHAVAIDLLIELKEAIHQHLGEIKHLVLNLQLARQELLSELQRIQSYKPYAECPNGYSLISNQEDLDQQYFSKILPEGGEEAAIEIIYRHLSRVETPELFNKLHTGIVKAVEQLFQPSIESLNIGQELLALPSQDLEGMLQERDREAYEMLPLIAECDREPEQYLLRVLLANSHLGGQEILRKLNAKSSRRQVPYELVEWDEPEQVALVQIRFLFPLSAWKFRAEALDAYRNAQKSYETLHTFATKRFLPGPGETLTPEQAQILLIKAYIAERLEVNPDTNECWVRAGDRSIRLDDFIRLMSHPKPTDDYSRSINPYFCAVDIESSFEMLYRQKGSEHICTALQDLENLRSEKIASIFHPAATQIAHSLTNAITQELRKQMDWVFDNTYEAAQDPAFWNE